MAEALQFIDFGGTANSILKDPVQKPIGQNFSEVLETQANEAKENTKEEAAKVLDNKKSTSEKKKTATNEKLPNAVNIIENDKQQNNTTQRTYSLLKNLKDKTASSEEEGFKGAKENANPNAIGQAQVQPLNNNNGGRKMSKSKLLSMWDKLSPTVTEDSGLKSVRVDIPLVKDLKAIVLKLNQDRSISASLLGSSDISELVKQNKDKLDTTFRHHNLSLREIKTYRSELDLNSESGTKKKKKRQKPSSENPVELL